MAADVMAASLIKKQEYHEQSSPSKQCNPNKARKQLCLRSGSFTNVMCQARQRIVLYECAVPVVAWRAISDML
jgi:hypothetical protein